MWQLSVSRNDLCCTQVETNWMCADTGKELLPNEIKTYHKFATSQVFFDKADMKEIKNFGKPCACASPSGPCPVPLCVSCALLAADHRHERCARASSATAHGFQAQGRAL